MRFGDTVSQSSKIGTDQLIDLKTEAGDLIGDDSEKVDLLN